MMISRRNFIKNTGIALGSATFFNVGAFALDGYQVKLTKSIGFQVWPIRTELITDFGGTLLAMAKMGYKEVEMCSPVSFTDSGFEPLNKYSGTELRKMIADSGLTCTSCHYNINELRDNFNDRLEWTQQMGLKQMILARFWLPEDTSSINDYRKAADELNKIAEKTKAAGIQMGFHNHQMDFQKRDDELIYDALLDQFDPDLVKMQFQVAVIKSGYKAADYFRKYPGRFISAHLSDWSAQQGKSVPVGQGDVDWKEFFEAAKIGGVKNLFVEISPDMFEASARYLLNL